MEEFLNDLIAKNESLVERYNEEDLKIYLISPLLNKINFLLRNNEIRGFYELPMSYETNQFILNGTVDFVVSQGLVAKNRIFLFKSLKEVKSMAIQDHNC